MANIQLPDLNCTTLLHIVKDNFQEINLKTYAVRAIYIGEHALTKEHLIEEFRETINSVNGGYCDVSLTGIFLVYDGYFVHILEGSEDTILRQLRFLFALEPIVIARLTKRDYDIYNEAVAAAAYAEEEGLDIPPIPENPANLPPRMMLKRMKLLMVYHSISTILFHDWRAVVARPPSLVGKLDIYDPLDKHIEQLKICLDKIGRLCELATAEETLSFEGLSANDPKMEALPEVLLLDFLIMSPYVMELRQFYYIHRRVDDYRFYYEDLWPLPNHFTPRHLYKLKIDDSFVEQLPVMPWEIKQETKEEDQEGDFDRKSKESSDSD